MMRNSILSLVFALLAASAPASASQNQAANPDSALQYILDALEGTPLPLSESVRSALEKATSVRAAEAAYLATRAAVRNEAGRFDPELFFSLNRNEQEQPTASFFAGADVLKLTETSGSAGVRMETPIGTSLEASFNAVKTRTNSNFAFLDPEYTAFGLLSLRQPLFEGFHVSARKDLNSAKRDMEAAKARYDQETLGIGVRVEESYWDLYAAERDYAVQELTRDRAEAFLEETELRARAGLVGPNQVASARTFLAQQEILLLDREEQLDRTSDAHASLIGMRPGEGERRFVTVDDPPDEFPVGDVDVLVRLAVEKNLDLEAARKDVASRRALSDASGWEALPSVDLVGSLGGSGLSGNPRDVVFGSDTLRTTVSGGFGDAARETFEREFPSWSIGVEVKIPIGLRRGLGERDRLRAGVALAEQQYIQQGRELEEEVRSSYRDLFHGQRRLKAARQGVTAAAEQVRIGLIEFQNGRTTAFELVRLGEDFAVAQQRYSDALVRSAKAAASLRQLTSGAYPGASLE
jgi:outer membrane protein TolC